MEQKNTQLPPDTDESYRAKLAVQHFHASDVTNQFIHEMYIPKVVTGILAYREPITIRDLKVNCNAAKLFSSSELNVMETQDPPRPVTSAEEIDEDSAQDGNTTKSLAGEAS